MSSSASVERDALRLFFGLPLPREAAEALAGWTRTVVAGLFGVRALPPEHLHVTLAFLGARPRHELPALVEALRAAARGCARPVLRPERYRETRSVAMVVLADEDGRAAALQGRLAGRLAELGAYRPERRPWLAHVTVARHRRPPGLRPELPALAATSPSEAALYHSVLRPTGAQYTVLEAVALGG